MSSLKIFNLKNRKEQKNQPIDKVTMQSMVTEHAKELLGLEVIASNIQITENKDEVLETLAIDEDYHLVVLEYRIGKYGKTINKGIMFLDYIMHHVAKIKTLVNEFVGYEVSKKIIMKPRLIVIGEDFNRYDEYAVKQLNFEIDLVKCSLFEKDVLILEKVYQGNKILEGKFVQNLNESAITLFRRLSEFVLSLGDEVVERDLDSYLVYRKITNFMYVVSKEYLEIQLKKDNKFKQIVIKNLKDLEKAYALIEEAYNRVG